MNMAIILGLAVAGLLLVPASAQDHSSPALGEPRKVRTVPAKKPIKTERDLQAKTDETEVERLNLENAAYKMQVEQAKETIVRLRSAAEGAYDIFDRIVRRCGVDSPFYKNKENWPTSASGTVSLEQFLDANCPVGSQPAAGAQASARTPASAAERQGTSPSKPFCIEKVGCFGEVAGRR